MHTPGPWVARYSDRVTTSDDKDGSRSIAHVYGWRENYDWQDANRRLIAAAPDMLTALCNVQKLISEAAMTGFNCKDGDWAERLFFSQQMTSTAIEKATNPTRTK